MKDIIASIVLFDEQSEIITRTINCFLDTRLNVEIILIDNSTSNTMSALGDQENVTYIHNGKNLGFAAGQNVGLKLAQSKETKYHLVLNPDIYFNPGVLEELFIYMEENTNVGCILPKVLYPDGSLQYLHRLLPTPFDLLGRRFLPGPVSGLFKKRIQRYELRSLDLSKVHEVPYLSGCFMFLRSNVLKTVGIFDERFFLYLDDVDYSRRIYQKYKNIFYPHVTIYHEHKRDSYQKIKVLKYHIISAIKYFNKWGWFFDKERRQANKKALNGGSLTET